MLGSDQTMFLQSRSGWTPTATVSKRISSTGSNYAVIHSFPDCVWLAQTLLFNLYGFLPILASNLGDEMKSIVAEHVSFRSSLDPRFHITTSCGHELLPILSRDLGSDEIHGWECIFCNERFDNYSAARPNVDLAPSFMKC
jgi:hypothetical protein